MVVWKFDIAAQDQRITIPQGAKLLYVATQRKVPCLWALVDPLAPEVQRRISVVGTGQSVPEGKYVGTLFIMGDALVFHVFDLGEDK